MSSGTLERIGPLPGPARGVTHAATAQATARTRALVVATALVLFLVALYPRMINLTSRIPQSLYQSLPRGQRSLPGL